MGPYSLYKKDSTGKVRRWTITIEDDGSQHILKTSHGVVGGAVVEDKGTNIPAGKQAALLSNNPNFSLTVK